jgi:hypothetical protein
MAHTFHIPVSFEFRKTRAKWREMESHIVGLSWDEFSSSRWELRAVTAGRGPKVSADLSLDDVPSRLWKQCDEAVDEGDPDDWDDAVEHICRDFRPSLLVASIQDKEDEGGSIPGSIPSDAWQLRDDFLRVTPDAKSVLGLLNRWGRWATSVAYTLRELLDFREIVRRALLSPPEDWLSEEHWTFDLDQKPEYPYITMETVKCKPAISTTVTMDMLRQVKFETCARPDCGQPFPIISKHKRKYCSQYCGHLESVRRGRAM